MKRVSSKLLFGAVFALSVLCISVAQSNISIIGINATRSGNIAEIELITTGPANFSLEPLASGDGVFVWAENFNMDARFGEVPLDLVQFGLEGLIDSASMVNDNGRSGLRIYPGSQADLSGAEINNNGTRITISIPAIGSVAVDPVVSDGAVSFSETTILDQAGVPKTQGGERLVTERKPEPETQFAAAGSPTSIKRSDEFAPLAPSEMDDPSAAWPQSLWNKPVEREPGSADNADAQSQFEFEAFSLEPVDGSDSVVPGFRDSSADAGSASSRASENTGPLEPGTQIAFAGSLDKADPQVNFQRLYSDPPPADSGGSQDADEELQEDMGKRIADEPGPEINTTAPFTTTSRLNPSGDRAEITFGNDPTQVSDGLDELSKIRINYYRIIDSPLDEAFSLLVANTEYNLIVDSSVGDNTISLDFKENQTDLKSALDLITQVYGLEYVVRAGTIVIASKEKMETTLIAHEPRLFVLSWAHPASIKEILINTNLVSENQIEIYAGEVEYPAVTDSTQLSSESSAETTDIKPIDSSLPSSPRNALLVRAAPEEMKVIAKVINDLDRKPKIIELEVRVCEAGESALRDLGVELNQNASTPVPTSTVWTEQPSNLPGALSSPGIEAFTTGSYHRSPLAFLATLNTQIQEGTVEVLAQPTLNTLEGKQAIYFAGERIPYIAKVSQTQTGQQIEVDFLNVGITLNFKPRLDNEGKLTIDVNPIVSSLLEFRIIGGLVEAPRTSSRQAATTVRVSDREPFVLAGLINETERTTITKVPLLGDLPLVGKLFRNKNKKGERTEIIVVVTPIIRD